jgi:hypothetical protein
VKGVVGSAHRFSTKIGGHCPPYETGGRCSRIRSLLGLPASFSDKVIKTLAVPSVAAHMNEQ